MATTYADLTALYQEQYSTNMPLALSEAKGGKLVSYCENADGVGKEQYTFYRDSGYSVDDSAPQVFNNDTYVGTGGQRKAFKASPRYIYAHELMKIEDMNKSMLKPDSNFMVGMANALSTREDIEVMLAIEAEAASIMDLGATGGEVLSSDTNLLKFKQGFALALAYSDGGHVAGNGAPVVCMMNARDYAEVIMKSSGEGAMFTSNDFTPVKNANGILVSELFGCHIVTFKDFGDATLWGGRTSVVPAGSAYFMPVNVVGFVRWDSGQKNVAEYQPGNADSMFFMARKSVGAIAIEPEAIMAMTFTASSLGA